MQKKMKKIVTETVTTTTTIVEDDAPERLVACLKDRKVKEVYIEAIVGSGIETVAALSNVEVEDLVELGLSKILARSLINGAKENFRKTQGNNGVYVTGKDVSGNIVTGGANHGNVDNSSVKVVKEKMWSKKKY